MAKAIDSTTQSEQHTNVDGRPRIADDDPLLLALCREHGLAGRADLARELLIDTWGAAIAVHKLTALFNLAHGRDPTPEELARMIDGRVRSL